MDPLKVRQLFEDRGRNSGRIDAVMDASASPEAQRSNVYREYVSRKAVLRAVRPESHERILDYGCGTGRMTLAVAAFCREAVGVDISESMLAQARTWGAERKLSNVCFARPEEIQGSFQKIFTFWVLAHHADDDLKTAFEQFHALTVAGGKLFVLEQVRASPQTFREVHIQRSPGAYPDAGAAAGFRLVRDAPVFPCLRTAWACGRGRTGPGVLSGYSSASNERP
ncbi:MAG: class I SAM-dependent methyltransferase [Vicinamibacteria bacterium]